MQCHLVLGRCHKVRDVGGLASCHTLLLLTFLLWTCAFYSEQFAVWCKLKGSFLRDMKASCPITKLSKTSAEVGFKSGTCKQNRILNVCRLLPFAGIFLCAFLLLRKVNSLHTVQYLCMLCSTYYSTLTQWKKYRRLLIALFNVALLRCGSQGCVSFHLLGHQIYWRSVFLQSTFLPITTSWPVLGTWKLWILGDWCSAKGTLPPEAVLCWLIHISQYQFLPWASSLLHAVWRMPVSQ